MRTLILAIAALLSFSINAYALTPAETADKLMLEIAIAKSCHTMSTDQTDRALSLLADYGKSEGISDWEMKASRERADFRIRTDASAVNSENCKKFTTRLHNTFDR
jgi:hypothetical protein